MLLLQKFVLCLILGISLPAGRMLSLLGYLLLSLCCKIHRLTAEQRLQRIMCFVKYIGVLLLLFDRELGENMADDELRAMIDEFDHDGDGESM